MITQFNSDLDLDLQYVMYICMLLTYNLHNYRQLQAITGNKKNAGIYPQFEFSRQVTY